MPAFYVSVPDVSGVPPVLRLPQDAIASASQNLLDAADGIAEIAATPLATLGSVSETAASAGLNISAASGLVSSYPSPLMIAAAPGVSAAAIGIAGITVSISASPSALVGSIAPSLANLSVSLNAALAPFVSAFPGASSTFPSGSGSSQAPQWGVFDANGNAVVTADNVIGIEYKQDWAIADSPIENGGFETYDKVEYPFDMQVTFSSGGSLANRQALLDSVDAIADDLNLYSVVTPDKTYLNVNLSHYDYVRTDGRSGLIKLTASFIEIREIGAASFSQTATPSGANPASGGVVQTVPPSSGQTNVLSGLPGGP